MFRTAGFQAFPAAAAFDTGAAAGGMAALFFYGQAIQHHETCMLYRFF
jgi:hypothetical protein